MTRTKSTDVKYSVNFNPIIEYWMLIEKGEEVVSQKIKILYRKLVRDINNPNEFFYSNKRANHVLEFAENYCRHSKGKQGGKRVVLELWEKAHLAAIFGFIDINGNRKYRQSLLIVGKKNGKSLLASIVGLYLMVADNEPGAEIYSVATKKDQAKIIWGESKRMVKKSPTLKQAIKPLIAEMNADFNDAVFKPLASDSDTLDGLNIHGGLMDRFCPLYR
jgi:phage terminase large subunit-like protein